MKIILFSSDTPLAGGNPPLRIEKTGIKTKRRNRGVLQPLENSVAASRYRGSRALSCKKTEPRSVYEGEIQ